MPKFIKINSFIAVLLHEQQWADMTALITAKCTHYTNFMKIQ